ncbi:MAG: hypothetical protein V3573_10895 [Desulfovibrionaceae bacterium]
MSEHTSSQYVKDVSKLIYDLALNACRKQVLVFSKELKTKMLEIGMEREAINNVIGTAFKGYSTMETFKAESSSALLSILEAYLRPSNRGRDPLGRLLVEYGIIRPYRKQVLFPDGSSQDEAARKQFVKGVVARPVLRYLLVAVRGSIPGLDDFFAKPVFFSEHNEAMRERKSDLESLIEEFTSHYNYGKTSADWHALYADERSMRLGYELLTDVLDNIRTLGPERVLKILNNIQNSDKSESERTAMHRLFHVNDVKQILAAFTRGQAMLAAGLGLEPPAA